MKHLYLALATLAFQVVFEWTVGHMPLLKQGGAMDMPRASFLGYEAGFRNHFHFWYYVSLVVLVLLAVFFRNLLRTRYGRARRKSKVKATARSWAYEIWTPKRVRPPAGRKLG